MRNNTLQHYSLPSCIVSSSRTGEKDRGGGGGHRHPRVLKVLLGSRTNLHTMHGRLVVSCSSNCVMSNTHTTAFRQNKQSNPPASLALLLIYRVHVAYCA